MLITLSDYARRHGKDISNVHRLRRRGRLPVTKSGWVYLIDEDTPFPEDLRKQNIKNIPSRDPTKKRPE